jgi:hypothetical protein
MLDRNFATNHGSCKPLPWIFDWSCVEVNSPCFRYIMWPPRVHQYDIHYMLTCRHTRVWRAQAYTWVVPASARAHGTYDNQAIRIQLDVCRRYYLLDHRFAGALPPGPRHRVIYSVYKLIADRKIAAAATVVSSATTGVANHTHCPQQLGGLAICW